MQVLVVTNMYPNEKDLNMGVFVKEQVESIEKRGIGIDILFINGKASKFNYIKGIWQLLRRSFNGYYNLVHAHYGLTGIVARFQWKYPLVVSFHGSDINLPGQGFLSKALAKVIDKSIVMTQELKEKLKDKKAEVIPCGVNLNLIKPISKSYARKKLDLQMDKHYLLFPADPLRGEKRYDIFTDVVKMLKQHSIIVEELILKGISHTETPLYYSAADVMVLTSDIEGSPVVIKEAMACNLPIVSVDVGDISKVLNGTTGSYIVEGDTKEIAEKVRLVLKKKERTNGRENIKHLSLENIAGQIITVYKRISRK